MNTFPRNQCWPLSSNSRSHLISFTLDHIFWRIDGKAFMYALHNSMINIIHQYICTKPWPFSYLKVKLLSYVKVKLWPVRITTIFTICLLQFIQQMSRSFSPLCIAGFFGSYDLKAMDAAIHMYRGMFLVILMIFLLGINTYGWRSSGVNHVLIFEIDPRHHLSHQQLLEVC